MSFQLMLPASIEAQQVSQVLTAGAADVQLSQEQSLCLVKIFLNASLGCICFARGLIPSDSPSYEDRRVDDLVLISLTSTSVSYRNFLSFQGPLSVNTASQPFKILVGGKDKRADHILNLVENGVFEAVDRGYLEAVQFSLSCDSSRRQDVIECYTFSFSYTDCDDSGRQICSVKVSPIEADHFYVAGAQKSFKKAIHKLLLICQQLPALPRMGYTTLRDNFLGLTNHRVGRRSLGVNLLYNPTCPILYEPSGFAGSPDANTFPLNDTSTAVNDAGKFHFGYYQIAVTAGRAKSAKTDGAGRSEVSETINDGDSIGNPTSSHLEDLATRRQLQAMQRSSSVPSNLISTQLEHALKGTQHDTQSISESTLSASVPSKRGLGKSVRWSSRRKQNVTPTKMAELLVQAWGLEINNQSYLYVLDMDHLRKSNKIKRLHPGEHVNCDCGSDHEEEAMTFCDLCGFWQHDICYGLQRAERVNDEMPAMVRMRLALTHIYDHEVQVIEKDSLIRAVHLSADDQATYLDLVGELEYQGFIRKTSRDGAFAVVKEQTKVRDARSDYLDPLARILEYYAAVKDKETTQVRAKAIQDALDRYTKGRVLDLGGDKPSLDKWPCKNALGRSIIRWGFYPERNEGLGQFEIRKRAASPIAGPGVKKRRSGRKMSISKTMINLDLPSAASSDIETDDFSTNGNAYTA